MVKLAASMSMVPLANMGMRFADVTGRRSTFTPSFFAM
jgi:hypothetical protein